MNNETEKNEDNELSGVKKRKKSNDDTSNSGKSESKPKTEGVKKSRFESKREKGSRVRVAERTEPVSNEKATDQREQQEQEKDEDQDSSDSPGKRVVSPGSEKRTQKSDSEQSEEPMLSVEDQDVTTEDFEALLNQDQTQSAPQERSFSVGDKVQGDIVAIGERHIFVDLGFKSEGIANREDFEKEEDGERKLTVEVGDRVDLYVLSISSEEILLGSEINSQEGNLEILRKAYESEVPVEGKVTESNKGGFVVDVNGVRAFCPISNIEIGYTEEPESHVEANYRFKVDEIKEGGGDVVLDRATLLAEERAEKREETLEDLHEGAIVDGIVTRVTGFGAFVDLGGLEGLVHVSELSHSHLDDPSDVIEAGEKISAKVLTIEEDDESDNPRIALSIKETEDNPWQKVNDLFAVGETVEGEVVRLAPFGAFVEVSDGIEGLVHVSEMSWEKHVKTPDEVVSVGDTVSVEIQHIDLAKQRMSLSIKEAKGDPWDTAAERYDRGQTVEGTVENIEDFGTFVRLGGGITALLPRSEMDLPGDASPHSQFEEGDELEARVLDVDTDNRKMALTLRDAEDLSGDDEDKRTEWNDSSDEDDEGGFGTLGDLIGDDL